MTSFRYPIPDNLVEHHSKGYSYSNGDFVEEDLAYTCIIPAGGAYSTANDMAIFMLAHLNNGEWNNQRILQTATANQMHQNLHQHHPEVNAMCYGFFDASMNGVRMTGHGGAINTFFSNLVLIHEQNMGLFISTNSPNGRLLMADVEKAFMDRYFPVDKNSFKETEPDPNTLQHVAGIYWSNRYSHDDFTKLGAGMNPRKISITEDNRLTLSGSKNTYLVQTGLLTF